MPSQPPKSQPAGWLVKNAWANDTWGTTKIGPAPITQKPPTGSAWGNKPVGSVFGTPRGSAISMGKNIMVDTSIKPPENIPEHAIDIEIKHVPAPGGFNSPVTDEESEYS